jgi:L-ascorbate metabolism protein UlaG (beta-lactamase superfamily)
MRHLLGPCLMFASLFAAAAGPFETDTLRTSGGELQLTFIGHGTLMFQFKGRVIHVDPVASAADYAQLPKADLILITHEHGDHFDPKAIETLRTPTTTLVLTARCAEKLPGGIVMANGEEKTLLGIPIRAVPAYNIVHQRPNGGGPFHPKGEGNGYVLTFGGTRVYVAGDTENVPEVRALKGIDVAFLPVNLPYTMTPEMAADAVRAIAPRIFYPYHFGNTDTARITELLKDLKGTEVRIRKLK